MQLLYSSDDDVEMLVRRFERTELPRSEWTHAAHLTVGLWFVLHLPLEQALAAMREGITRYNNAVGIKNTDTSGYHETLTVLYVHAIQAFVEEFRSQYSSSLPLHIMASTLVSSEYSAKDFPLLHYSRERLFSVEARKRWVEPDIQPLPRSVAV